MIGLSGSERLRTDGLKQKVHLPKGLLFIFLPQSVV